MTAKMSIKGSYTFRDMPVELEWELPAEYFEDNEVFEKIGQEMRRIAEFIRKREAKWLQEASNRRWQKVALENLRWLFVPRPELVERGLKV